MTRLNLGNSASEPLKILCLGAHSDDIEIGCGGTLLQLAQSGRTVTFHWVVFTAAGQRGDEARAAAARIAGNCETTLVLKEFRDGFLPYNGALVKESFEEIKKALNPDLIFTHWHGDAHQDHRLLSELTWNTFRDHLILEYEIPKYDGDLGRPNVFVPISDAHRLKKIEILCDSFGTQRSKAWFTPETFFGLMRLRGMESNAPSGYAEAFHARKLVLGSFTATQEEKFND